MTKLAQTEFLHIRSEVDETGQEFRRLRVVRWLKHPRQLEVRMFWTDRHGCHRIGKSGGLNLEEFKAALARQDEILAALEGGESE